MCQSTLVNTEILRSKTGSLKDDVGSASPSLSFPTFSIGNRASPGEAWRRVLCVAGTA